MNMSYCRFQNTLIDLRDCASALEDLAEQNDDPLSHDEERAAIALVETCARITALALEKIQRPGPQRLDADDIMDGARRDDLRRFVQGKPIEID